ncbi:MAG: REP-associated tyrosine transposase [Fimbriimonadaceae bacterium]
MGNRVSYNDPGQLHELTFSTFGRVPVLSNDLCAMELLQMIIEAKIRHSFLFLGYCFMPDHVHLLINPTETVYSMSSILHSIKSRSAIGIKRILKADQSIGFLDRLSVNEGAVRIWQQGGGFDRNVYSVELATNSLRYIHNNPVKAGIVQVAEDYKWSSASAYLQGDDEFVDFLELM